jgi:uncharacterized protein (DUF952 family)
VAARGGQHYPHFSGALPVGAAHRAVPLPLGPDGVHAVPLLED